MSGCALSLPHSLGRTHGTPASAAASISFVCCSGGAVTVSVMMRASWPFNASTRAEWEEKSTFLTVTPEARVPVLSRRVIAVRVCFPLARRALVICLPIWPLPYVWGKSIIRHSELILCSRMLAYADNRHILDVSHVILDLYELKVRVKVAETCLYRNANSTDRYKKR